MKITVSIVRFIFLIASTLFTSNSLQAQCPAAVPLTINDIIVTESRCQNSGTARVIVSNGKSPYLYSIIAGPIIPSPQSDSVFLALSAGVYTMQVTDACSQSVTLDFTIAGSYSVPLLFTSSSSPTCQSGNDGSITMYVLSSSYILNGSGRMPFSYSLESPSHVVVGPQTSNVFTGLPPGDYFCKVTDSCGNYQTRIQTVYNSNVSNYMVDTDFLHWEACDSFSLSYHFSGSGLIYKFPYTVTLKTSTGVSITKVIHDFVELSEPFRFHYHPIQWAPASVTIDAVNACGEAAPQMFRYLSEPNLDVTPTAIPGCSDYMYTFDNLGDNRPGHIYTLHCDPVTYKMVSPSGVVVATQVNNSVFTGIIPDNGYKLIREDCCSKDSLYFNWEVQPPFEIVGFGGGNYFTCKENVTGLYLLTNTNATGSIIVESGPPNVIFADGTVHTYTYPDTVANVVFNDFKYLEYFTIGTYRLIAITDCGQRDTIDINVLPSFVRHSQFSDTLKKGCVNDNKIVLKVNTNESKGTISIDEIGYYVSTFFDNFDDEITNLPTGTYHIKYEYGKYSGNNYTFFKNMDGYSCDQIIDTLEIPPYTQPSFSSPAVALCDADRNVALLPDSSNGVQPYLYQITGGPYATSLQTSPVFGNLPKGTYNLLMADACSNSYSLALDIDTLILPDITMSGNNCMGGKVTYKAPYIPYFSYAWQRPNGTTTTGESLVINPVTPADIGTYHTIVTSNINGCSDSRDKSFKLNLCIPMPLAFLDFSATLNGSEVLLYWHTTNEESVGEFIVERSADGINFDPFQYVPASGQSLNSYTAIDYHPLHGNSYYRVKQISGNGQYIHSSIVPMFRNSAHIVLLSPNPANRILYLQIQSSQSAIAKIQISYLTGDNVIDTEVDLTEGIQSKGIDVSRLAAGMYVLRVFMEDQILAAKFIKY